jgi:hypothetical protein
MMNKQFLKPILGIVLVFAIIVLAINFFPNFNSDEIKKERENAEAEIVKMRHTIDSLNTENSKLTQENQELEKRSRALDLVLINNKEKSTYIKEKTNERINIITNFNVDSLRRYLSDNYGERFPN